LTRSFSLFGQPKTTAVSTDAADVARATDVVGRRLVDALAREGLSPVPIDSTRHAFGRSRATLTVTEPPGSLLHRLGVPAPALATELEDAISKLAAAYGRRRDLDTWWRTAAATSGAPDAYAIAAAMPPDEGVLALERLGTEGHNLHPCGRTRLGWTSTDAERYDQESAGFAIRFVEIRRGAHIGDDVGALLRAGYPGLPEPDDGYLLQPVHPWQLEHVLRGRYAQAFADGSLRETDADGPHAVPTTAVRTLLLAPDGEGRRRYLKLSLDIQITSTRRNISIATTQNGPSLSRLLPRLLPDSGSVLLPEIAGAAFDGSRDIAAIVRDGLHDRLEPGEVAVPATALPATSPVTGRTVLAEIVDRSGLAAVDFLAQYARVLLTPLLSLLSAGIGLEAHLQNSIPIFRDGRPTRIAFRDLGGLRINSRRLATRGIDPKLWPATVVAVDDQAPVLAKVGYTALQAHLGELVIRLGEAYAVPETQAWRAVRDVVEDLTAHADPADRAFLFAPTMPHKALVRMRLAPGGDIYTPVPNPLAWTLENGAES
jgi:siderophore synthetase component